MAKDIVNILNMLMVRAMDKDAPALDRLVMFKAAEKMSEQIKTNLLTAANAEYAKLQIDRPKASGKRVEAITYMDGLAELKDYTPKTTWTFSDKVNKLEAELNELKAKEKEDKTAKSKSGKSDQVFSITIAETRPDKVAEILEFA